jgi:hypothetical protein
LAISEAESLAHSALDRGWIVAMAGPATAIINATTIATTIATVASKTMRGRYARRVLWLIVPAQTEAWILASVSGRETHRA